MLLSRSSGPHTSEVVSNCTPRRGTFGGKPQHSFDSSKDHVLSPHLVGRRTRLGLRRKLDAAALQGDTPAASVAAVGESPRWRRLAAPHVRPRRSRSGGARDPSSAPATRGRTTHGAGLRAARRDGERHGGGCRGPAAGQEHERRRTLAAAAPGKSRAVEPIRRLPAPARMGARQTRAIPWFANVGCHVIRYKIAERKAETR